jgi:hypothetical protein
MHGSLEVAALIGQKAHHAFAHQHDFPVGKRVCGIGIGS